MTKTIEERLEDIEKRLGAKKVGTTHIAIVQDKSASMKSRQDATIDGYNDYVSELASDTSDKAKLTLIQFDTTYTVVEKDVDPAEVQRLTRRNYRPAGMTALLDAVGRAIDDLKDCMGTHDRALVVVMTDGKENSSKEYSREQIKEMVGECEDEGNWTFVYLGAGPNAWAGGDLLGVKQTVYYGSDSHSHRHAYRGLSAATHSLRSGPSGQMATFGAVTADVASAAGATVDGTHNHTHDGWLKTSTSTEDEDSGKDRA